MSYGDPVRCAEPLCPETVENDKFSKIKASEQGWFFQKDDGAWCPAHIPAWVPAWREEQKRKKEKQHERST